jgi:hypothetical protein
VWFALQQRAVPFVETPNDVLRRLLGLPTTPESAETGLAPAPPGRGLKGKMMALWFINTDAKTNNGHSFHEVWLTRGIAVTSGPQKFGEKLARIPSGDAVLMYVNGAGVVAVGITLDDRVQDVVGEGVISPVETREYHRRVRWLSLPKEISPATLKELCGQTPLQTVQRVRKGEDKLRGLLREALQALSSSAES